MASQCRWRGTLQTLIYLAGFGDLRGPGSGLLLVDSGLRVAETFHCVVIDFSERSNNTCCDVLVNDSPLESADELVEKLYDIEPKRVRIQLSYSNGKPLMSIAFAGEGKSVLLSVSCSRHISVLYSRPAAVAANGMSEDEAFDAVRRCVRLVSDPLIIENNDGAVLLFENNLVFADLRKKIEAGECRGFKVIRGPGLSCTAETRCEGSGADSCGVRVSCK